MYVRQSILPQWEICSFRRVSQNAKEPLQHASWKHLSQTVRFVTTSATWGKSAAARVRLICERRGKTARLTKTTDHSLQIISVKRQSASNQRSEGKLKFGKRKQRWHCMRWWCEIKSSASTEQQNTREAYEALPHAALHYTWQSEPRQRPGLSVSSPNSSICVLIPQFRVCDSN